MSTKTLRKRIALVAVSALGFGLVSVAPANAAATQATLTAVTPATVVAGSSNVVITFAGAATTTKVAVRLASGPVTNIPGDDDIYAGNDDIDTAADPAVAVEDAGTNNTLTLTDLNATFTIGAGNLTVPGVYTFQLITAAADTDIDTVAEVDTLGAAATAATATVTVLRNFTPPTAAGTLTLDAAGVNRADMADVVVTFARPTTGGHVKGHVLRSPDTHMPAGTTLMHTGANALLAAAANTNAATGTYTFENDGTGDEGMDTAGTYEFLFWSDDVANNSYDSGEAYGLITVIVGGAPAAISASISPSIARSGDRSVVTYTVTDSLARATLLNAETIDITAVTGFTFGDASVDTSERVGTTNRYATTIDVGSTAVAGANSVVGTLSSDTTKTATASLTVFTVTNGTSMSYTAAAGILPTAADDVELTTTSAATAAGTITVDLAATTVYFNVSTGTAATRAQVTVTPNASTNTGLISNAGVNYYTALGDGSVTFAVTTSTTAAGRGYTVTLEAGATDLVYTVVYADPGAAWTIIPGTSINLVTGGSQAYTAVLKDVFGRALASKAVTAAVSGRNTATFAGTTDAAGVFSFTTKDVDTRTLTDAPSDTITLTYNYTNVAATAATATGGSATITYLATAAAAGDITITPSATTRAVDQLERVAGVPIAGARVTYTATVRTSTGAAIAAGTVCNWTADADTKFYLGASTGATSSGQCSVTVYRQKTGYAAVTVSAGGMTASNGVVLWSNQATDARNIVIAAAPASVVSAGTSTITATVTDRWGNPVNGVAVTFAEVGPGRVAATAAIATNVAGVASTDFTSNAGETGSNTVSASMGGTTQTADLAGFVEGVAVAGVTAGNRSISGTVTITADTSTSTADALLALATALGTRDQASAAVDAAAEATDAANAATDAANAAAEAADAATAAAQDAADAVTALSTQVSEMVAALKKQITSLTNLVIKIQKKVKA